MSVDNTIDNTNYYLQFLLFFLFYYPDKIKKRSKMNVVNQKNDKSSSDVLHLRSSKINKAVEKKSQDIVRLKDRKKRKKIMS